MKRVAIAFSIVCAWQGFHVAWAAPPHYRAQVLYPVTHPDSQGLTVTDTDGERVVGWEWPGHAAMWTAPDGGFVSLHTENPDGFAPSAANGVHGSQQVGKWSFNAYVRNDSAASGVNLHPTHWGTFSSSEATNTNGTQQVGFGETFGTHALLWNGTAASAVDLHPSNPNIAGTWALATDGVHQVGYAYGSFPGGYYHAFLWNGSAASAIDLHPTNLSGFVQSTAYGVNGTQQVGSGQTAQPVGDHALLWNGSADSAVDLHPGHLSEISRSFAKDTNGSQQIGFGYYGMNSDRHALLWNNTADSALDLHMLLPPDFVSSDAFQIDASGVAYGIAYNAAMAAYAVKWVPVPEPGGFVLAAIALIRFSSHLRRSRSISRRLKS